MVFVSYGADYSSKYSSSRIAVSGRENKAQFGYILGLFFWPLWPLACLYLVYNWLK